MMLSRKMLHTGSPKSAIMSDIRKEVGRMQKCQFCGEPGRWTINGEVHCDYCCTGGLVEMIQGKLAKLAEDIEEIIGAAKRIEE
jgi:hypothetical protein